MRVLVLGGDGFCGWPTALHLSAEGWDVTIVDNLSRRNIDNELEVQSLTPIRTMGERIAAWQEVVIGAEIGGRLADDDRQLLEEIFADDQAQLQGYCDR